MEQGEQPAAQGEGEAAPEWKRGERGRFAPGTRGGPGRNSKQTRKEKIAELARALADPELGPQTFFELAREWSPALLRRVVQRGLDPETPTREALECARFVAEYAHGRPMESLALAHTNVGGPSAQELEANAAAAFLKIREAFARARSVPVLDVTPEAQP